MGKILHDEREKSDCTIHILHTRQENRNTPQIHGISSLSVQVFCCRQKLNNIFSVILSPSGN